VVYYIALFFLCLFSLFSFSTAFEFHSVEVQPDEEVTLQCSNLSSYPVHLFWFRSTNRPSASRISSMVSPESNVTFYEGFQNGKFNMASNTSVLFLEIKQVDSSDSGLYVCGLPSSEKSIVYGATNLKVQGKIVFIFSLLIHLRQLKRVLSLLPVKKLQILLFIIPRELETNVVYSATR
uniref:Ig-like domain-containing protein n=1 Tax=Haplochromis burtoni TaxID=8153 RepID=A0A3Q2WJ51_HAPBU